MAERRMFALKIIDSDAFLDMPKSSQALYFHLSMRADDDGFISNPKKIMRMIGSSDDDMKILLSKRFLLSFDTGIVVIKHWRLHNYIAKDRYNETIYKEEKDKLFVKANGSYTDHPELVPLPYTGCIQNDDTGKVSEGKVSEVELKEESPKESAPVPEKLYSSESYILADLLSELHIQNIDPKCKPITPKQNQAWAKDIEMIERIDGRSYQDIEKAIRWVKTPGQFWAPNIMSGSKLREKFPTIWAQMSQRQGYQKPAKDLSEGYKMPDNMDSLPEENQ